VIKGSQCLNAMLEDSNTLRPSPAYQKLSFDQFRWAFKDLIRRGYHNTWAKNTTDLKKSFPGLKGK